MYIWIFFGVFFFMVALAGFIGAMKARKYKWQLSVSRIIILIVSAILAAVATSLLSSYLVIGLLAEPLSSAFTLPENIAGYLPDISLAGIVLVFIVMVVATLIFIPIFWIMRAILKLFLKLLAKGFVKLTKDELSQVEGKKKRYSEFKLKKGSWISALCGAACGILTMLVMAFPIVGLLTTAGNMALPLLKQMPLEPDVAGIVTIADEAVNNPATVVVNAIGGGAAYDAMTYCKVDEKTDTLTVKQDIGTVTTLVDVVVKYNVLDTITEDPQAVLANENCTYDIIHTLIQNPRFAGTVDVISDTVVYGFMKKINIPETDEELYTNFIGEMQSASGSDYAHLYADYDDIFDEYGLFVDDSVKASAANAKLAGADMVSWTAQNVVADAATFASQTQCIVINDVTTGCPIINNTENEARTLAHAIATVCGFNDDVNSSSFDVKKMINLIGPMLDSFAKTETVGPIKTEYMLMGILQSKLVHDKVGLSVYDATQTAKSIYESSKEGGYVPVMGSIAYAVEVVENASSGDKSASEPVKNLISNLTPATSAVLQTVATPSVVKKYGVPQKSAEPVANIVSNTFKNLSTAKENGMSDEEYEKEAVAVSNMMDVLMNADKADKSSMFGEESITGVTAIEYVNNVLDSKVMTQTLIEKVYADGDVPAEDPLNSGMKLKSEEKSELMTALSDKWAASAKDDAAKKEIVALAAIMNVKVEVTESGVREIVDAAE